MAPPPPRISDRELCVAALLWAGWHAPDRPEMNNVDASFFDAVSTYLDQLPAEDS